MGKHKDWSCLSVVSCQLKGVWRASEPSCNREPTTDNRQLLQPKREQGFTLVEILVTLTILSAVLPALLQVFASATRNQALADDNTTALYLLKFRMAEIEMSGYPDVGEETGEFGDNSRYQWRSVVEDMEPEQIQGVRRVQVTVSWQHLGKARSMAMSTFIADRQIQETQTQ